MTSLVAALAGLLRAVFSAWLARQDPIAAPSHEAGVAEADLATTRSALQAQWRVTEAAESAPKTKAEIDDLLRKGEA